MVNIFFVGADSISALETRGLALCLRLVRRLVPVPCLGREPQFWAALRTEGTVLLSSLWETGRTVPQSLDRCYAFIYPINHNLIVISYFFGHAKAPTLASGGSFYSKTNLEHI
jgi:hypothetical protein